MGVVASKGLLIEDNVMSRFYTSLLHYLHLVLSNPKGSISEHVASFVMLRVESYYYLGFGLEYFDITAFFRLHFNLKDLCQVDLKSVSAHWKILLPTSDVLQPRKYQATLMTCLLFDPILKTQIAAALTLAAMLDGPSSIFLQVVEYKESTKRGPFTTLSSSLGEILMQLHTGRGEVTCFRFCR
ncbi:uncharacterized protein LOC131218092 [Magnolia sinica]|uniref:uncharacterized protein LOC131218092 n=1 Tax=Magnolia sinica TaxID=86752 RepID=UPI002659857D|nr:uncharacterized protein LOC131218092 [Magnolia sinica]